jgi:hypothetical protein
MIKVTTTKPDGGTIERSFETPRKAAQFGVAYFLADNSYATRAEATRAATTFQALGEAECNGFKFVGSEVSE